jgi:hypothetical protein
MLPKVPSVHKLHYGCLHFVYIRKWLTVENFTFLSFFPRASITPMAGVCRGSSSTLNLLYVPFLQCGKC